MSEITTTQNSDTAELYVWIDGKQQLDSEITHAFQATPGQKYWRVRLSGEIEEVRAFHETLNGQEVISIARVDAGQSEVYPFSYARIFGSKRDARCVSQSILQSVRDRCDVVEREDGNYDVISGDNTYTVTGHCPEFGNEYVTVWSCNCPAGQHGRDCKHVQAVLDALN